MLERLFCSMMKIDNFDLISDEFNKQEEIRAKWKTFKNFMAKVPLLLTCGIGKNFGEVNNLLERLDPLPKVVIVDYIQGIKQSEKERSELNEYIRNFRQLMLKKDCVGVLASQMNRQIIDNTDKRPSLENLKSTGVLEEHADLVLMLYWEWFYSRKEEDKNKYEIIVGKNRNGRTGSHKLFYTPEWYLFTENAV
jgi:replicative DNA helicase